jgi:[acyl-carrier-protein] S-malonyltransferase
VALAEGGLTAFIFPGQGAQFVGMGQDLHRDFAEARQVFERASEAAGFDVARLCFDGPAARLAETEITQPTILTASLAALAVLEARGLRPDAAAGLSLGEYGALAAAGSLAVENAVPLVHRRGRYMQEAVPLGEGAMAAILGLARPAVEACCRQAASEGAGVVEPANYNCPGQIVVAGATAAVQRAAVLCREAGARKAMVLPVSAPFHCRLMQPAAERLAADLQLAPVRPPRLPVVANATAQVVASPQQVREALVQQVTAPVRWEECVERLWETGVRTFVEVGPGTALCGFVRRIRPEARLLACQDVPSLTEALRALAA